MKPLVILALLFGGSLGAGCGAKKEAGADGGGADARSEGGRGLGGAGQGGMASGGTNGSGGATGGGGALGAGGALGTGGLSGTGGTLGAGGRVGLGGATGAGGSVTAPAARARTIIPFDSDWLFFKGDATGAQQPDFADATWRRVDVPHDWSIEGPFAQNNATAANGGYLPSGVGWYRKHFTLPAELSDRRVFVELDGVMANSDVSINGFSLGRRPSGYVSFRYELTGHVTFGATSNVLSVRTDTSTQPASRWYAGAGIYRHVRVIATDAVHVDKWATFVTTPAVTAAQATVHVQTTILNQGATAQSVSVQAVVSDAAGVMLPPVTSAAQTIAPAGSAVFALDVQVTSPRLWSVDAPVLYQLLTSVRVGGVAVDDDVTPFGIRTIKFDPATGFSLNGASVKLKGIAMHHDMSGLGAAVPTRALQRRLAQLKTLGVNAIRTSHNPFGPELYDLCDRMGLLVMDEFLDAWVASKVRGDGSTYFRTWGTIDVSDTIQRDRNHPSIVIYSIGNEIRDSVGTRLPIAMGLVQTAHTLDPTRPVTQALFRPKDSGDYPGATLDVLDVFGVNYRIAELIEAIALTPRHAGLATEMTPTPSDWTTISNNPAVTGEFLWTGVDYLGESEGWPAVGADFGLMDRVGTVKDIGYRYQALWSKNPVVRPPVSNGSATKVVLSADHARFTTDLDDVVYIKATVADGQGAVVTSSSAPVTFSLTGPGVIVAVDSGANVGESFRGSIRAAYQGICYAIVRGTGVGAITVSATASGLTGSSVTVQSTEGPFVPCAGSCD